MEKFALLVKGLLSNRSGIVLATLNVCYFVSRDFFTSLMPMSNFDKIMLSQNSPALVFSFISQELTRFLFQQMHWSTLRQLTVALIFFFITLQWLFIGWAAKMIARKIGSRGVKE